VLVSSSVCKQWGPCGGLILQWPWAPQGRCRISPPPFLAECRKRRLNQGSFVSAVCLVVCFLRFVLCLCVYSVISIEFFPYCLFVSNSQVIGCEDRLRNDLYCVGWGVKLYSVNPIQSCKQWLTELDGGDIRRKVGWIASRMMWRVSACRVRMLGTKLILEWASREQLANPDLAKWALNTRNCPPNIVTAADSHLLKLCLKTCSFYQRISSTFR